MRREVATCAPSRSLTIAKLRGCIGFAMPLIIGSRRAPDSSSTKSRGRPYCSTRGTIHFSRRNVFHFPKRNRTLVCFSRHPSRAVILDSWNSPAGFDRGSKGVSPLFSQRQTGAPKTRASTMPTGNLPDALGLPIWTLDTLKQIKYSVNVHCSHFTEYLITFANKRNEAENRFICVKLACVCPKIHQTASSVGNTLQRFISIRGNGRTPAEAIDRSNEGAVRGRTCE